MNVIRNIAFIAVAVIGFMLLMNLLQMQPDDNSGNLDAKRKKMSNSGEDETSTGIPCQTIPNNLPRYQDAATPSSAKTFLNVPDADWTPDFEARLGGFFLAVDVAPSNFTLKFFGRKLIWRYLNSPDGQLSDLLVLKGAKHCA